MMNAAQTRQAMQLAASTATSTATSAGGDATAIAKRDAIFDRMSHLFRHAGSDVTMQALFRVLMDYRVAHAEQEEE
jgi:hypothetical protein